MLLHSYYSYCSLQYRCSCSMLLESWLSNLFCCLSGLSRPLSELPLRVAAPSSSRHWDVVLLPPGSLLRRAARLACRCGPFPRLPRFRRSAVFGAVELVVGRSSDVHIRTMSAYILPFVRRGSSSRVLLLCEVSKSFCFVWPICYSRAFAPQSTNSSKTTLASSPTASNTPRLCNRENARHRKRARAFSNTCTPRAIPVNVVRCNFCSVDTNRLIRCRVPLGKTSPSARTVCLDSYYV